MSHPLWASHVPLPLRPASRWPNGKRLALYVAVGIEEYRFGDGMAEDLLPGVPRPDYVNTAWRDYGNRAGGFRLIDALSGAGIRPTVLINTDAYRTAPDLVAAARVAGAEFVGHGQSNSDSLALMSDAAARDTLDAVAQTIALHEGARPGGWSSPWLAPGAATLRHLGAAGYRYLLDLRLDDQPAWLGDTGLLAVPYGLELNDSTTMIGRQVTARDFADMIVDEFDELREAARDRALVMSVVVHSFISGAPFRLRALRRALAHICAHAEDVWFVRPGDIAAAVAGDPTLAAGAGPALAPSPPNANMQLSLERISDRNPR